MMTRTAAEPIADVVRERLHQLNEGLGGRTVEEVALAMIAGAGQFLYERSSVTRAELEQRIAQVLLEGASLQPNSH